MKPTARASALTALAATFVFVTGVPAHAATTRVVHQGQSIQAAINASHAGDTVVVQGGVYRESLTITTSGITLLGRGALIEPPARDVSSPCDQFGDSVVRRKASPSDPTANFGMCLLGQLGKNSVKKPLSNVLVAGFTVRGFANTGIFMLGGKDVVIRDNVAQDNDDYGIARFVSSGGRVEDNQVSGAGEAGIYWGDSPQSDALIQGNHAFDNGDWGIFVRDSSHGTVRNNITDNNCVGMIVLRTTTSETATDWTLQNNVSHDNDASCPGGDDGPSVSGIGIAVAGADHIRVLNNSVSTNKPSGPSIASAGVVVISTKSLGGSVESNVAVHGNTLTNNKPANIVWDGKGTNVRFSGNSCSPSC